MAIRAGEGLDQPEIACRSTQALPFQAQDRVALAVEEQLYSHALHLLAQCLTAGASGPRPALVPSPDVLAFLATLAVHPSMTTRTTSSEKHTASDQALQYLQILADLTSPQQSGLRLALRVNELRQSRSARARPRNSEHEVKTESTVLVSVYARDESLWTNAGDIWQIIGWAFNCSIAHKHRWRRWKSFMRLLLDVLDRDLKSALSAPPTDVESQALEQTLLHQYLVVSAGGGQHKRRIMKAVLADGGAKSMAEFPEVWRGETMLPRVKSERPDRDLQLDLDNDKYADYDDSSDEDGLLAEDIAQQRADVNQDDHSSSEAEPLGDVQAVQLRQELLSLLLTFCSEAPQAFLSSDELLELYAESLRNLSIRSFQQLLYPVTPHLSTLDKSTLDQMLLRTLLGSSAPVFHKPKLEQDDLETYFAPFSANLHSVLDNAKVSLLIEDLLRMLWKANDLRTSDSLRAAITKGIEARNEKARFDARKRNPNKSREERDGRQELRLSAERMLCILDMIQ